MYVNLTASMTAFRRFLAVWISEVTASNPLTFSSSSITCTSAFTWSFRRISFEKSCTYSTSHIQLMTEENNFVKNGKKCFLCLTLNRVRANTVRNCFQLIAFVRDVLSRFDDVHCSSIWATAFCKVGHVQPKKEDWEFLDWICSMMVKFVKRIGHVNIGLRHFVDL